MRRVGALTPFAESDPENQARVTAFRERMRELGWMESPACFDQENDLSAPAGRTDGVSCFPVRGRTISGQAISICGDLQSLA